MIKKTRVPKDPEQGDPAGIHNRKVPGLPPGYQQGEMMSSLSDVSPFEPDILLLCAGPGQDSRLPELIPSWKDLALPPAQVRILRDAAAHARQFFGVPGNGKIGNRRKKVRMNLLFAGENREMKRVAALVFANELNLPLYRIDLSQVAGKYRGETEKNIRKLFDAAEESRAILFFDEADALFCKRSEVKDSHDRYANIEVSYLLQRMEEYRGLAILTTNMKDALDPAFLRRIRFSVGFPYPDEKTRKEYGNNPVHTMKIRVNRDSAERNGYFSGTLMTGRDFSAGQEYHGGRKKNNPADLPAGMVTVPESGTLYGALLEPYELAGVRGAGIVRDGLYFVKEVTHRTPRGEYRVFLIRRDNGTDQQPGSPDPDE